MAIRKALTINANKKTIRRIGDLPRILMRKPVVSTDGKPLFELERWRCSACGISLFYADGTCSVCNCAVRIPMAKG